ncbi:MAG: hypothetical protein E7491_01700 [Ruminococcaceae bacterium]|nr:hypothetical protein [Oscillospiraceae bacterium]
MKIRNMIVILLVIVLCFASCGKQDEDMNKFDDALTDDIDQKVELYETETQKIIRELDAAYEEELGLPENYSTTDYVLLHAKYAEKWDRISEEYYNRLLDASSYVTDMKDNWEEYAEKQWDSYDKFIEEQYSNGSVGRIYRACYNYKLHREWAVHVLELYGLAYIEEIYLKEN